MREIKFRAWDNKNKRMIKEGYLTIWQDNMWHIEKYQKINDTDEIVEVLTNVYGVLMQFTGLKDKNGVEIYEGDIIENDTKEKEIVVFEDGEFTGKKYCMKPIFRYWEVIGNIYENQELLEDKSHA